MLGTGELIVIFLVVLILFGGKKLPELARSIGLGIREFKKACEEGEPSSTEARPKEQPSLHPTNPPHTLPTDPADRE